MNFTFGIITGGVNNHRESLSSQEVTNRIYKIIESIELQNIPKYEIIIIGGNNYYNFNTNIKHISFNENEKPGWITKKKNLITENAIYENIVFMHDYLELEPEWYKGFLKFGNDWDVCMNIVNNINGGRWVDWLSNHGDYHTLIPYDTKDKTMYVSGAYWVAKKSFMKKYPLNENLLWGQGEDMEWSNRWINKEIYKMNINSSVKCCKKDKKYSVIFSTKSEAIKAFKTSKLEDILKWYNPSLGPNFTPWEINDTADSTIPTIGLL